MGSPLGPISAEFYMNNIEQRLSHLISSKTLIYCRYVDDIFIMTREEEDAGCLIQAFEDISVLKFTHECSDKDSSLPFLDVLVKPFDDKLHMKVHVKPINVGECLKASVLIDINVVLLIITCPEHTKFQATGMTFI